MGWSVAGGLRGRQKLTGNTAVPLGEEEELSADDADDADKEGKLICVICVICVIWGQVM